MHKVLAITPLYEQAFQDLMDKAVTALTDPLTIKAYSSYDKEDRPSHKNYKVVNGVGLYSIEGAMIEKGNWFTDMMGMANYESITNDIAMMRMDESVKKPLIKMSTPGGSVAGLSDVGEAMKALNAEKGVTIHSASRIASAGIWLGSYADNIYGSEVAEFGSVGVIMSHMSHAGALEQAGMEFTEIKSKSQKAIGSPYKALSDSDKAYLQKKVEDADALFEARVREGRPGISSDALSGEMFSAAESERLGLIDGIKTFAEVYKEVAALAADSNDEDKSGGFQMKIKMTEAMASAAIELGASADEIDVVSQEVYDALTDEEKGITPEGEPNAEDDAPEADADADAEVPEELAALTAKYEALEVDMAGIEVELENAKALNESNLKDMEAVDDMKAELAAIMGTKRIALGLAKVDFADFTAASVLVEYKALDATFKKTFKPGGIVPKSATTKEPAAKVVTSSFANALCDSASV